MGMMLLLKGLVLSKEKMENIPSSILEILQLVNYLVMPFLMIIYFIILEIQKQRD